MLPLHNGDFLGRQAVDLVDEGVDLAVGEGDLGLELAQSVRVLLRRFLPVQLQYPVHQLRIDVVEERSGSGGAGQGNRRCSWVFDPAKTGQMAKAVLCLSFLRRNTVPAREGMEADH